MKNSKINLMIVVGISFLAGFTLPNMFSSASPVESLDVQEDGDRQPLYWVAPMDSNYRRDEPGLSPMGMELVPVYEDANDEYSVRISPQIQQNLGIRTTRVELDSFNKRIQTTGYTRWDESSIEMLHPRAEGWIEVFNLASVGDRVEAGQILYELYSPTLVSAQREYLSARQSNNASLAMAARDRLLALGFTQNQVTELEQDSEISQRLIYRSQRDAIVTQIGVREGNYIQPQTHIATLASLDSIWIDAEVFESDAGLIEEGLPAQITLPSYPGEVWESAIAYVYPELEPQTRTLQFRILMNNPDQRLKPNMFANVEVQAGLGDAVLTVPREAVIRSGEGARVIKVIEDGQFQVQPVTTGFTNAGRTEILQGLNEGELIVSSGQFLLDSEANGEQAIARLMSAEADGATSMEAMDMEQMPGMDMDEMNNMVMNAANDAEAVRFSTSGVIRRVGDEQLTIAHEPVEALNWPSMTMGFDISPSLDVEDFEVNDAVTFEFEQGENGMYRIITIEQQEATQ